MKRGKLIVISGPSGVGKSTLIRTIMKNHPDYQFSVSATTRPPRPGEVCGKDYHFLTKEAFLEMVQQDALLEYNHYASGDYYGTPAQPIHDIMEQGGTVLLDVDPNGALQVRQHCPEAVLIFVAPPSMAELHDRLVGRHDTPQDKIQARLDQARWEIQQAHHYQYLVMNDEVEQCVARLEEILLDAPEAAQSLYENNCDLHILKEVI